MLDSASLFILIINSLYAFFRTLASWGQSAANGFSSLVDSFFKVA